MTFLTCREDEIVLFRCVGVRGGDPVWGWNDDIFPPLLRASKHGRATRFFDLYT